MCFVHATIPTRVCACRARPCRATTVKLEQQLRSATKPSPPEPQGPRTWANVSVPAPATATATSPGVSAKSSTIPLGANSRGDSGGRRASYPEASKAHPVQARQIPNQLPRAAGGGFVSMRRTLENQQKAATMFLGDTKKQVRIQADSSKKSTCVKPRMPHAVDARMPYI